MILRNVNAHTDLIWIFLLLLLSAVRIKMNNISHEVY